MLHLDFRRPLLLTGQGCAPPLAAQGKMSYASGSVYQGQWEHDRKNGQGTMHWARTKEEYVGQWLNGHQHGVGMHTWLSSQSPTHRRQLRECYAGQWHGGERHGQGVFLYANGSFYVGQWQHNLKHGQGEFVGEDGTRTVGEFVADRPPASARLSVRSVLRSQRFARQGALIRPAHAQTKSIYEALDLDELLATDRGEKEGTQAVVHACTRFNDDMLEAYRIFAAVGRPKSESFALTVAQLDSLMFEGRILTLDITARIAHRLFFGAILRPGVGQRQPTRGPRPSVQDLVDWHLSGKTGSCPPPEAWVLDVPSRPILLREFVEGLVRLAHARNPQLPNLAQRCHDFFATQLSAALEQANRDAAGLEERAESTAEVIKALEPLATDLFAIFPENRAPSCHDICALLRETELWPGDFDLASFLGVCRAHDLSANALPVPFH